MTTNFKILFLSKFTERLYDSPLSEFCVHHSIVAQASETCDKNVHHLISQLNLLNLCSAAPNQLVVVSAASDERQNIPAYLVGAEL